MSNIHQEIIIDNNLINCVNPGQAGNDMEIIHTMPKGIGYPKKGKKKPKKKK